MSVHIVLPGSVSGAAAAAIAHPASRRGRVSLALCITALGLMLVGGFLPWLSVFHGLTELRGFSLDGGFLAFIVLAVVAILFVQAQQGGARVLRPIAVIAAGAVIADSIVSAGRIAAFVRTPGPAGAVIEPSAGPGPVVFAVAGGALLAGAIVAPAALGRLGARASLRLVLAVLLLAAAVIHLILTPEHLGISTLLGLGFLAAGLAQVALAGLVVGAPRRVEMLVMAAVIAVNVALIVLYLYAVLVGLPFESGHTDDTGIRVGAGEPVDLKGGVDFVVEIAAVAVAGILALGNDPVRVDE
jgi:hypothetical protein